MTSTKLATKAPATRAAVPSSRDDELLLETAAAPELIEGPTRDELIRRRAFDLYERDGCVDGHSLEHWLAAEAEVDRLVLEGTAVVPDPA